MKLCFLTVVFLFLTARTSALEEVHLFFVQGQVDNDGSPIPYFTFSEQPAFQGSNAVMSFPKGTDVKFIVENLTQMVCGFNIPGMVDIRSVQPNASKSAETTFEEEGVYAYGDPTTSHVALGATGMIVVGNFNGPEYYGVFMEHDPDRVYRIMLGANVDQSSYSPEAFTINGLDFPATMDDSLSFIEGKVGQVIRIHLLNGGLMYHFPHFHGYHVKVLYASIHKHNVGRLKDSFGMAPGEGVTVELIPDKPGLFPMHNHNLVTTTTGGNYPGGMLMHMNIHE